MYAGVLPAPAPLPRQPRPLLREPQKGGGTQLEGGAQSGGPECWRRGLRGVRVNRISAFAKRHHSWEEEDGICVRVNV